MYNAKQLPHATRVGEFSDFCFLGGFCCGLRGKVASGWVGTAAAVCRVHSTLPDTTHRKALYKSK